MSWEAVRSENDGVKAIGLTIIAECPTLLALYLDQVISSRSEIRGRPLWFPPHSCNMKKRSMQRYGYDGLVSMEKPNVCREISFLTSYLVSAFITRLASSGYSTYH